MIEFGLDEWSNEEEDGLLNVRVQTSFTTGFIAVPDRSTDWLTKKTKTQISHWSVNDGASEPMVHACARRL